MQHSPCTGQHHLQHLRDENTLSKEYIDIHGCLNYHLVSNSSTVIKELTCLSWTYSAGKQGCPDMSDVCK